MAIRGPTGLTQEQRRRFDERGLVRLDGLIPEKTAEAMADRLWAELARREGIEPGAPGTWRIERPFQFQALQASGAFDAMATPALRTVLDDLMGRDRWAAPVHWGQPLVCFPTPGDWDLPHSNWHLDGPCDPSPRRSLVGRLFVILAPLAPQGGGTLVATGSHRIVEATADRADAQLSSSEMRKRLRAEHGWFDALMSPGGERIARFMDAEVEIDGVPVLVEEMTGRPGDLYLMHPRALHAPAPNKAVGPRLVVTQFVPPRPQSIRSSPRRRGPKLTHRDFEAPHGPPGFAGTSG
jgi:ectoine hydroxylase-related dioxygenase (phytanoyl-CoA dioxygenase family)